MGPQDDHLWRTRSESLASEFRMINEGKTIRGQCSWNDALTIARCGDKYLVSSPNMTFIPQPPIGIVDVVLYSDYRYGLVDPIQWPQIFTKEFGYLCAVPRPVSSPETYAPLWWTPAKTDFTNLEGSMFKSLGLLTASSIKPLLRLVDFIADYIDARGRPEEHLFWLKIAMQNAATRLHQFPCTFRDAVMQVRETQRYSLMARAFMDYADNFKPTHQSLARSVRRELMGAFTTDPNTVQLLFSAGVPVWFIRTDASILDDTKVRNFVHIKTPDEIYLEPGPEGGHVLYHGLSGEKHIRSTAQGGHTYFDISRAPLLAVASDSGYPAPISQKQFIGYRNAKDHTANTIAGKSKRGPAGVIRPNQKSTAHQSRKKAPHPSQIRNVNRFLQFDHPWMPKALPSWAAAMTSVDLSRPARPNGDIWGYWIPEPALLLRPSTAERRDRYIMTWLHLRAGLLYMLRLPEFRPTTIPTQWWRDVLYGPTGRNHENETTLNAQRARSIEHIFSRLLEGANADVTITTPVRWFGIRVSEISADVACKVIWEMHDLAFRYELQALDRLLVPLHQGNPGEELRDALLADIFPDRLLYSLPNRLPDDMAFYSTLPNRRVFSLEAFKRVLSRWPRCPPEIHNAMALHANATIQDIERRERELAAFYVHSFFEQSGRAPIVPHVPPVW